MPRQRGQQYRPEEEEGITPELIARILGRQEEEEGYPEPEEKITPEMVANLLGGEEEWAEPPYAREKYAQEIRGVLKQLHDRLEDRRNFYTVELVNQANNALDAMLESKRGEENV